MQSCYIHQSSIIPRKSLISKSHLKTHCGLFNIVCSSHGKPITSKATETFREIGPFWGSLGRATADRAIHQHREELWLVKCYRHWISWHTAHTQGKKKKKIKRRLSAGFQQFQHQQDAKSKLQGNSVITPGKVRDGSGLRPLFLFKTGTRGSQARICWSSSNLGCSTLCMPGVMIPCVWPCTPLGKYHHLPNASSCASEFLPVHWSNKSREHASGGTCLPRFLSPKACGCCSQYWERPSPG